MIKIVLIDDHELVRSGLRNMLEADTSIKVVGETGAGAEGVQIVQNLKPDVVSLDIQLPDISGLEVTHKLLSHDRGIKILIISAVSHDLFPFRLLEAGALGYLTKNAPQHELIQAVKLVYAGQRFVSPAIAQKLVVSKLKPQATNHFSDLSDREMEVMSMVIRGFSVKKIAQKLHVSTSTVHSYRSRIFQKLNIKNDMGLMLLAIKEGIVTLDAIPDQT